MCGKPSVEPVGLVQKMAGPVVYTMTACMLLVGGGRVASAIYQRVHDLSTPEGVAWKALDMAEKGTDALGKAGDAIAEHTPDFLKDAAKKARNAAGNLADEDGLVARGRMAILQEAAKNIPVGKPLAEGALIGGAIGFGAGIMIGTVRGGKKRGRE